MTCGQDDPWVILTGKMAFQRDKRLAKVAYAKQLGILNFSKPLRMTPVLMASNSGLCGQGGHLDREDGILERQVLGKSCNHYDDSCGPETFSVDFTVCKLQTC